MTRPSSTISPGPIRRAAISTAAIPLARRAWALDRDNPATADTLGWLLFKSGATEPRAWPCSSRPRAARRATPRSARRAGAEARAELAQRRAVEVQLGERDHRHRRAGRAQPLDELRRPRRRSPSSRRPGSAARAAAACASAGVTASTARQVARDLLRIDAARAHRWRSGRRCPTVVSASRPKSPVSEARARGQLGGRDRLGAEPPHLARGSGRAPRPRRRCGSGWWRRTGPAARRASMPLPEP